VQWRAVRVLACVCGGLALVQVPVLARAAMGRQADTSAFCSHYVIGFSTGHVGTTTLNRPVNFIDRLQKHTGFVGSEQGKMKRRQYKNATLESMERHAREQYLPKLHELILNRTRARGPWTCVDMSHASLSFYEGLHRALLAQQPPPRVTWVRVRRPSMEFARSVATCPMQSYFCSPRHGYNFTLSERETQTAPPWNIQCLLLVGFCGVDEYDSGAVSRAGVDKQLLGPWNAKFSVFQKALWIADETEMQWLRFVERYRPNTLELGWSKARPEEHGTMGGAIEALGGMLGLRADPSKYEHDGMAHSLSASNRTTVLFNAEHTADEVPPLELRMLGEYRRYMRASSAAYRAQMHRLPSVALHREHAMSMTGE
jgi:hypothetical protein